MSTLETLEDLKVKIAEIKESLISDLQAKATFISDGGWTSMTFSKKDVPGYHIGILYPGEWLIPMSEIENELESEGFTVSWEYVEIDGKVDDKRKVFIMGRLAPTGVFKDVAIRGHCKPK